MIYGDRSQQAGSWKPAFVGGVIFTERPAIKSHVYAPDVFSYLCHNLYMHVSRVFALFL